MSILFKIFRKVPEWDTYYPSLSEATIAQKKFYKHWLNQLNKDNFIDIKGNLSYVFVYLYSLIERFIKDKDINYLTKCFEKITKGYGEYENIQYYITYWTFDAYLYLKNYDKAWETGKGNSLEITDVINFRAKCVNTSIDGQDLMCILGKNNGLTEFGKNHQKQISPLATVFLEDFQKEHGKNLIEYFCGQFDFPNLTEEDFERLREFYPNEKNFLFWKENYEKEEKKKYPYIYGHYLFGGVPISPPWIECEAIPSIITVAIKNEGKRILRECENTLREEANLPKVGEGWISEKELFYRLKEAFQKEKVIHHGRPAWLSPQHLDIYFPLRSIGVEYQGAQHQNPVEYFGGEKAFEQQQKLDRRKSRLCNKHDCKLIYVYEGYNLEKIRQKIEDIIADKKSQK